MTAMPPAAGRHRPSGASRSWVVWLIGIAVVVIVLILLARSIPAAPRPSLGPPSTPASTATTFGPSDTTRN
jgi:hypothetical protein